MWRDNMICGLFSFHADKAAVDAVKRARRSRADISPRHAKSRWFAVAVCAVSVFATLSGYAQVVTPVSGESWLDHLGRRFGETSMGRSSGVYGPAAPSPSDWPQAHPRLPVSENFTAQPTKLYGKDLFRMKCQACHGPEGKGAPPEINSVIDPVRATSAEMYVARMKKVGMDVSMSDAQKLAKQAEGTLLKRLRAGGTDMPSPNPYLTEAEVRSLYAYLRQLAVIPGAEKHQVAVVESPLRVGEHIVKSTCHICHGSVGHNPDARQLLNGDIPPLSSLTQRVSVNEFVTKVLRGAPVLEGSPAIPVRGHMPAFNFLAPDEVADVYLYLTRFPPQR